MKIYEVSVGEIIPIDGGYNGEYHEDSDRYHYDSFDKAENFSIQTVDEINMNPDIDVKIVRKSNNEWNNDFGDVDHTVRNYVRISEYELL